MTPKKCPKCGHSHLQKHGKIDDKQRYLCPNCKFQFTRIKPVGKPKKLKKMALKMYLEGLGFRQSQSPEALKASNWANFGRLSQLN